MSEGLTQEALSGLVQVYGIVIIGVLALIEGPVVSILAGALARLGLVDPRAAFAVVVAGDLLGDLGFYLLGRHGACALPRGLARKLGLTRGRMVALVRAIRARGVRILVLGKLTHAAGFAVLLAAGAARMGLRPFLAANLGATAIKASALMALGWAGGSLVALF